MSEPETEAGRRLLAELSESPLPGARYAREVAYMRLPAIEAELRAKLAAELRARPGLNGLGAAALIEGSDPASPEAALDVERLARALPGQPDVDE